MHIKKFSTAALACTMLFTACFPCMVSASGSDGSKCTGWADAYMETVRTLHREDKKRKAQYASEFTPYQPYTYSLTDFNNDSIPELVAELDGYHVSMYTYAPDENKVYTVMDQWGYGAMGNTGYEYLPGKNYLRNYNSDFAGAVRYTYYGTMKHNKIVSLYPKKLKIMYYKDKNHNQQPDEGEYTGEPYYYYGGRQISEKKYNSYLIKGKFRPLAGTMKYKQIKKKLGQLM